MKFSKKILSLFTCFLFIAATFIFAPISSAKVKAADLPVQLYYATAYSEYSGAAGHIDGFVSVKNIDYSKNVTIHYSYGGDPNQWKDVSASYLKTNPDGYEVWKFNIPSNFFGRCYFCIEYKVDGQTYWDNNNGNNYSVGVGETAFGKSQVSLMSTYPNDYNNGQYNTLSGSISTTHTSNAQVVKVRYTEDNWITSKDVNASYNSTSSDKSNDYWTFSIDLSLTTQKVQLAVCYEVNGVEYWDNNFGSNYTIAV